MNIATVLFSLFAFALPISKDIANGILMLSVISTIWIFVKHKQGKSFSIILQQPFVKPVILFLGCILFTIPFSGSVLFSLREYYRYLGDIAPFMSLLLLKMVTDRYTVCTTSILHAFFAGLSVACLYAIYQTVITHQLGTSGFYENRIFFGYILEVAIPMVLSMSIVVHSTKKSSVYGILVILYTATVLLTQARGPWLGIVAGIVAVIYINRKKFSKRNIIRFLSVTLIFCAITTPLFWDRAMTILSGNHTTNVQRIHIWQYTLHMIQDHSIVGIGLGQYEKIYASYVDPMEKLIRATTHAHNSYLMIFAEAGVIGFSAFIYLLLSFKKLLGYILRRGDHTGMASGFVGIFCAVLITSFVDNAFFSPYVSKMFWLLLGVLLYSMNKETDS